MVSGQAGVAPVELSLAEYADRRAVFTAHRFPVSGTAFPMIR